MCESKEDEQCVTRQRISLNVRAVIAFKVGNDVESIVNSAHLFFFNDTPTTEIYTLSLHDALPISGSPHAPIYHCCQSLRHHSRNRSRDRKSTRLNSSHVEISYAVFCLKKKKSNYSTYCYKKKKKTKQKTEQ